MNGENICPICQESLDSLQPNGIYTTPCNHKYHTDCFVSWCSQSTGDCPVCRETHMYINNMDYSGRILFLKDISQNKECPKYLKITGKKIDEAEKKLKNQKKILQTFKKENKEFYKEYIKINNQINKTRRSIILLEDKLLGIPILELPPDKLVKTKFTPVLNP